MGVLWVLGPLRGSRRAPNMLEFNIFMSEIMQYLLVDRDTTLDVILAQNAQDSQDMLKPGLLDIALRCASLSR